MKTGAMICEFNPFHNGHKKAIEKMRNAGCSHIVCIMSGNFVQRGEAAIENAYIRAETAVMNGADLVIELPPEFALSSAENFAKCGVYMANEMACIDYLGFGVNCNKNCNNFITKILFQINAKYDIIKEYMRNGQSYPLAVSKAISESLDNTACEFLKDGNNILALSYINELNKINSKIKPIFIERDIVQHDDDVTFKNTASASYIRKLINENNFEEAKKFIPQNTVDILKSSEKPDTDLLKAICIYKIHMSNLNDLKKLPDIGRQGLANRFYSNKNAKNIDDFLNAVKTKRYTMARIKRIVLNLALGITANDIKIPKFGKILAFNKNGTEIIKEIKKKENFKIDTSLARLRTGGCEEKRHAEIISASYDLYSILTGMPGGAGYSKKISIT